jgi:murein DD-endopeptidase MepM/ murein hydrolase activator NlpD
MIKNRVCPPSPVSNPLTRSDISLPSLFERPGLVASFAFILLCVVFGVTSSASAQTRLKPTSGQQEERLRRVDDKEQANAGEPVLGDSGKEAPQNPQVRKTALTYSPRPGTQSAERPALTNDIVIISRASESSMARRLTAAKTGAVRSNIPSIWPVVGILRSGVGVRSNPFGGSSLEFHKGQDISAPTGTPINATADGVVVKAGWMRGYGNGIYIDHGNGITTRYGHLSRIDVVEGQPVRQGQHLGLVGSTGRSTGPHLHYEVRINGEPTSPLPYLPSPAPPPAAPLPSPAQ